MCIQDLGLRQSMVSMVAALIGMIPEGLFLLTSVALALSVVRLAQNKTLIHEMNAVETLARVDVLCVDKTGTVTLPEMELREVLPLDEAACPKAEIEDTLGAFYRSLEADNDTARAIQKRYPSGPYRSVKRTVPFTSATKWSAVDFGEDGLLCHRRAGVPLRGRCEASGGEAPLLRLPGLPGAAAGPVRRGGGGEAPRASSSPWPSWCWKTPSAPAPPRPLTTSAPRAWP